MLGLVYSRTTTRVMDAKISHKASTLASGAALNLGNFHINTCIQSRGGAVASI